MRDGPTAADDKAGVVSAGHVEVDQKTGESKVLYRPITQTTTPTILRVEAPPKMVSGLSVARRVAGESKAVRAVEAAYLSSRGYTLQRPTIKQWAALCGVSAKTVHAALKLSPAERGSVRVGLRPLVVKKVAEPIALPPPASDAATLAAIVARHGVDSTLEMIADAETATQQPKPPEQKATDPFERMRWSLAEAVGAVR